MELEVVFRLSAVLGLLWLLLGFSMREERCPDWLPELREERRVRSEADIWADRLAVDEAMSESGGSRAVMTGDCGLM